MFFKDYKTPEERKNHTYEVLSKAEYTDLRAKIWFESPAYGKYQGRRNENERDGQTGVYRQDESIE